MLIGRARIWIAYEPYLYGDLLARLFESGERAQVVTRLSDEVDVIVFPTNAAGQPKLEVLPAAIPEAKLIAVSPSGDSGWVRVPGESHWQQLRPCNLRNLCHEAFAGRQRPVTDHSNWP